MVFAQFLFSFWDETSSAAENGNVNSSSCPRTTLYCNPRRITCLATSCGPCYFPSCAAEVITLHLTACWNSAPRYTQHHIRGVASPTKVPCFFLRLFQQTPCRLSDCFNSWNPADRTKYISVVVADSNCGFYTAQAETVDLYDMIENILSNWGARGATFHIEILNPASFEFQCECKWKKTRARNGYDEEAVCDLHDPRAWLSVLFGGLCRRRLDGALPISY